MQTSIVNNAGDMRVPAEAMPNGTAKVKTSAEEPKIEVKTVDKHEITKLQTALAKHDISLKFSQDDATNSVVVQMIDGRTGEAIRQFPTEVSLNLAANFMKLQGVFLDVEK